MSATPLTSSKMTWLLPATLACLLSLTACSSGRPIYFDTKQGYLELKAGQTFVAPRDMTLATEAVVQRKDEQILDLLKVNQQLLRQLQYQKD